jgi:hypothetical protein
MNHVVKKQSQDVSMVQNPDSLLTIALERGADSDQLTKLLDLKERYEASEARKAFSGALADFQSELEPIIKRRRGHNSSYADIDDIAQSIRPLMKDHGLSYRFEQEQENGQITVSCIVSHRFGHTEKTVMSAAADASGGKNAIQAIASAVTYLRRYTLTGALGITTGNDDDDGGRPEVTAEDLLQYNQTVRDEIHTIAAVKLSLAENDYSSAKEAWMELDENTMRQLWKAPSKGGIFTTDERTKMKSTEWGAA